MTSKSFVIAAALAAATLPVYGANLCVSASGSTSCYNHIGDAVSHAAPSDTIYVGPGTYFESVTIGKSLSLAGDRAVIDAAGLSRGIYVDGIDNANLTGVHVTGFTVQNANLEGILVANASAVSIANNTVINNNKSLVAGTCPGLESFETLEQSDCGEGIHLLGADHAIVTNNLAQGNSGGILITDDTAAAHDNLISFNTVVLNPYACGITMASHPPAAMTASAVSLGVYHNTVYGNRSKANGLANGGGAGIGIFASVPFTRAYANVVVDNFVSENGLPGIAMHAHAPFQVLNDNMIVGNTITNNGADAEDAYTPGPTGINIYSLTPVTGNTVSGNSIQGESYDVAIKVPAPVLVQFNGLLGLGVGVINQGVGPVDASGNWWSCPNGPTLPGSCSAASGGNILVSPWLTNPIPPQPMF